MGQNGFLWFPMDILVCVLGSNTEADTDAETHSSPTQQKEGAIEGLGGAHL